MNYIEVKDTVESPVLGFMDKETATLFFQNVLDISVVLENLNFVTIGKTMEQNRKLKNALLKVSMSDQFMALTDTQWVVNKGSYANYACKSLESFESAIMEIPSTFAKLEAAKRQGNLQTPANEQLQSICNRIVEDVVDALGKIVATAKVSLKLEAQPIAGL